MKRKKKKKKYLERNPKKVPVMKISKFSKFELSLLVKQKRKGTQGLIDIENPNFVKPKNLKAKDVDLDRPTELSRREREELEKQRSHERYMKLREQGKTDRAKLDLERLALIRQQRADAAKKREEERLQKNKRRLKHANETDPGNYLHHHTTFYMFLSSL